MKTSEQIYNEVDKMLGDSRHASRAGHLDVLNNDTHLEYLNVFSADPVSFIIIKISRRGIIITGTGSARRRNTGPVNLRDRFSKKRGLEIATGRAIKQIVRQLKPGLHKRSCGKHYNVICHTWDRAYVPTTNYQECTDTILPSQKIKDNIRCLKTLTDLYSQDSKRHE